MLLLKKLIKIKRINKITSLEVIFLYIYLIIANNSNKGGNMKHYLLILLVILLSACSLGMANTPSEKVKELLNKYKNQDSEIMKNLDEIVTSSYSGDYADRYKKLMVNQYKNMEYEITDEIIEGDSAIVTARITVFDYASALDRVNSYLSETSEK